MINIKTDSRKITPGDTFVALKGIGSNGDDYIEKAIENGASKIVCEKGTYFVTTENVEDTREYLVNYLKEEYHSQLEQMKIIGVTGTNGKTTTAFLLSEMLNKLGKKSAYIGTIGFFIGMEKRQGLDNTTPDVCDLYELLLDAYEAKCDYVVLEASSQGLSYERLDGISFDLSLFTNLTQDHLDYHKTMENYALAKQKLFQNVKKDGIAIVNFDDSYKHYFLLEKNQNITYGFDGGDYQVLSFQMNFSGMYFIYRHQGKEVEVKTNLLGKYNISNLLLALVTLDQLGFKEEQFIPLAQHLEGPSGRMEIIPYHNNLIVIDYAHTPDAMECIIHTMKEVSGKNLYVVFGCTGSRDRGKRPVMAHIATKNCKYAIFTSDDLHDEKFDDIINDMIEGLEYTNYEVCEDRRKAIQKGIDMLKCNDILLILGKGHEEVMIMGNQKIPFHDRTVVEESIDDLYNKEV